MGAPGASPPATLHLVRAAGAPGSVFLRLAGHVERADVDTLGRRAAEILAVRQGATVICDVGALRQPDAAAVEAICRIRLAARRARCDLVVQGASARLFELFELMGLCDALPLAAGDRSGVQPGR